MNFGFFKVLILAAFGWGWAGSASAQEYVVIGQPSIFWHNGEWQTCKDGVWSPYGKKENAFGRESANPGTLPGGNDRAMAHPRPPRGRGSGPWGKPGDAIDKPNVAVAKNPAGIDQPNIAIGQRNSIGQPAMGLGQRNAQIGQPMVGLGQRNAQIGQPTIGIGRPNAGFGQPSGPGGSDPDNDRDRSRSEHANRSPGR